MRSENVRRHATELTLEARWAALGRQGATIWLTGLPASGKSTVAHAAEAMLVQAGRPALVLDGDNLRHGLTGDLGFTHADRVENIRRTSHVAMLLAEAGVVALVALVSPYAEDRQAARARHADKGIPFYEVWVSTPLEECERRDPKGLYARARRGEVKHMTGIDDPYEPPANPDLVLDSATGDPEAEAARVLGTLLAFSPAA